MFLNINVDDIKVDDSISVDEIDGSISYKKANIGFEKFKAGWRDEYGVLEDCEYFGGIDPECSDIFDTAPYYRHYYYFVKKRTTLEEIGIEVIEPEQQSSCVCGKRIKYNCYLRNKKNSKIIVCGSCCIKKFIVNGTCKQCPCCNKKHKRRKSLYCFDCDILDKVKDWTIRFGKYKGMAFKDLPIGYVEWLIEKDIYGKNSTYGNEVIDKYIKMIKKHYLC